MGSVWGMNKAPTSAMFSFSISHPLPKRKEEESYPSPMSPGWDSTLLFDVWQVRERGGDEEVEGCTFHPADAILKGKKGWECACMCISFGFRCCVGHLKTVQSTKNKIISRHSEEDIMLKASQRFVISTIKAYMTEPRRWVIMGTKHQNIRAFLFFGFDVETVQLLTASHAFQSANGAYLLVSHLWVNS